MAANKNDRHARIWWGDLYDSLPKSVFATAAWHLANVASESPDSDGAAEKRFFEELKALVANGMIPKQQVSRLFKDFP